jgi:hypothetical protein
MVEEAARPLDRNGIILFAVPMVITTIAAWIVDVFSDPLLAVNDWIGTHRIQLTLLTFAMVTVGVWRSVKKGESPIEPRSAPWPS